ncbi:helix-turn-helix transcriptional regulator [Janibacter sp. G349]|uniref:helix-turn-helix transcriptional regulator n=1 Tax=Janibacter sp. G349 TaxID=3405424 RepID=UPI003B7D211E
MAAPNTPAAKTERLLNLTMSLLSTRIPLPKQRIRRMVEAYRSVESDEAFDRMFERDKEDLRAMGIPLVTEEIGVFEDEQGYRIDRRDYALAPVELTTDERAVVGLASRAWAHATMAGTAATAWRKIAADDEVGEDPFVGLEPQLGGTEPAFEPLKDAVLQSTPVRFDYARPGAGGSRPRHVEPWYLTAWHGRWYLVGHDLDREAARVFRLSRIASAVTSTGEAPTVPVPDDLDPVSMIAATDPAPGQASPVALRVRVGTGHGLRRRATSVTSLDGEWDRVELDHSDLDGFVSEVVSHGSDVVVEEPAQLRTAVVDRLRAVVTTHEGSSR